MIDFKDFQAAVNDELSLPYGLSDWLSLINKQTKHDVRLADEAEARNARVFAGMDREGDA